MKDPQVELIRPPVPIGIAPAAVFLLDASCIGPITGHCILVSDSFPGDPAFGEFWANTEVARQTTTKLVNTRAK